MNARAVLLVVSLASLSALAGCSGIGLPGDDSEPTTAMDTGENVSAAFVTDGERTQVTLEVANSPDERRRGLMFRESLPETHGMVFVYGDAGSRSFWMKNTLIPLDIIFVDSSGTVLNVEHAAPQPEADDSELRSYRSDGPAKYVVEMDRGFANRTGVGPGTQLTFDGSPPTEES